MTSQLPTRQRIQSIDVLRGIVMVIMALDHTRDFFHIAAVTDQPTNMATTTPMLFFTRWITHFCAPTFVFLSGTSIFLNGQKKTTAALSIFLLKRGCWLIVLDFTLITFILTFNPLYYTIFMLVLWAIGISMVLLALLIRLPFRVLLSVCLLIFFSHNLLDYAESASMGKVNLAWSIMHGRAAVIPINGSHLIIIGYSFLPWTGLMILGYCCGKLFTNQVSAIRRRKLLLGFGLTLIALFIVGRLINKYGDPVPCLVQKNSITTLLSFMNVNKYPPSLLFCCMTIGPALITLALIENVQNRATAFFTVYGRVPLFYFILHFFLIHLLCVVLFFASGYSFIDAYNSKTALGFRPANFGYPLWIVYLIWVGIVLLTYPLCKKYNRYKSTHSDWWLSYL